MTIVSILCIVEENCCLIESKNLPAQSRKQPMDDLLMTTTLISGLAIALTLGTRAVILLESVHNGNKELNSSVQ